MPKISGLEKVGQDFLQAHIFALFSKAEFSIPFSNGSNSLAYSLSDGHTKQKNVMASENNSVSWPDLAINLYDRLTERNAKITYQFEDMNISVPSGADKNADNAEWKINGSIRVSTSGD